MLSKYKYNKTSKQKLNTCDKQLQRLFNEVIKYYDNTITCGFRDQETQNRYYKQGKSKLKFPESKHNKFPSKAVDSAPFIGGKISYDIKQCYHYAGFVLGIAKLLGINIRCGADWDSDNDIHDQSFNDLVHFELRG